MPLPGPTAIPPISEQTDPDKVRVAAIVGGQLASAPARGFGLTGQELTALQVLTALPSFGAGVMITTVVTTSGTYTKPAGLRYLEVTVIGAGGGGTRTASSTTAASQSSSGGGGGGGSVGIKLYAASALAATEAYTIGAAGVGGNATAGGNSVFKGVTATGGAAGGAAVAPSGVLTFSSRGAGGTATGGDLNIGGGFGLQGVMNMGLAGSCVGGSGGGSFFSPVQSNPYTGSVFVLGYDGSFPGGGGNGSAIGASQAAPPTTAGAGGAGCIIFKEFF